MRVRHFWYKNIMTIEISDQSVFSEIQKIMADVFEVDLADISTDIQFGDLPKWDSMGHMDLMLALETKFSIAISADSIRDLVSIPAILQAIQVVQNG